MCNRAAMHPRWGRRHAHAWKRHQFKQHRMYPPVNIEELDDQYEISFFAAGYAKSDFQISLSDDTLSVSAKSKRKEEEKGEEDWYDRNQYRRREFKHRGFERHFVLNEKIEQEKITAKYEDGVLKITLPKKEGAETVRTQVDIE